MLTTFLFKVLYVRFLITLRYPVPKCTQFYSLQKSLRDVSLSSYMSDYVSRYRGYSNDTRVKCSDDGLLKAGKKYPVAHYHVLALQR